MKSLVATLVLAGALAGCASFGNTDNPPVAKDASFMDHPGTTFENTAPGHPPLLGGPSDGRTLSTRAGTAAGGPRASHARGLEPRSRLLQWPRRLHEATTWRTD